MFLIGEFLSIRALSSGAHFLKSGTARLKTPEGVGGLPWGIVYLWCLPFHVSARVLVYVELVLFGFGLGEQRGKQRYSPQLSGPDIWLCLPLYRVPA